MLTQLPYEMCATIAQFTGVGPIGDLFRVAAGPLQIREIRNDSTYLNGALHSFNDLPAIEWANGDKWWYRNNKVHRDNDLPAKEYASGDKWWYRNGNIHEYANGYK